MKRLEKELRGHKFELSGALIKTLSSKFCEFNLEMSSFSIKTFQL